MLINVGVFYNQGLSHERFICMEQQCQSKYRCWSIQKTNGWTSAVTLSLYTCYFTFNTYYVILSGILHEKSPFRHGFAPTVSLATAWDLGSWRNRNKPLNFVNRAHAPLLLAEKLRRGQSAINDRSSLKYRDLLYDRFNGKVQEDFSDI